MTATTNTMIGYTTNLPASDLDAFRRRTGPVPSPGPGEILVRVEAVSVNPVDVKVRGGVPADEFRVLGYDAAGVVEAVGDRVTFVAGDEVFSAGSIGRSGSDQRYQLVEARLVGKKPASVTFGEAASLPLTALTAWEGVFDRLGLDADSEGDLLVVGASGGVGSILLRLVRALAPRVRLIARARARNVG